MSAESIAEQAAQWLSTQLPAMEEAMAALVNVNSYTENVEGGRKVAALLSELFSFGGLELQTVSSAKFADHVVIRSGGSSKPAIGLIGHLDTVFPPGTFEGYRRDGERARGPGVFDMKGGLVILAFALKALDRVVGLKALPPMRIAIVSDEEVGSPEGQQVIRDAFGGVAIALGLEPGRDKDQIVTRRKGTGGLTVTAYGKAAHAGNQHEQGKNAIWALARFIDAAQRLTHYPNGVTVNVGKISGGTSKNTVPDRCEAQVDLRFNTKADMDALIASLEKAAVAASNEVPGTRLELKLTAARTPMERSDASVALMNEYGACATKSGLLFSEAALVGGGSDASTTSAMGISSIDSLGPRGGGFHTTDEFVELSSFVPKAQALARFIAGRA